MRYIRIFVNKNHKLKQNEFDNVIKFIKNIMANKIDILKKQLNEL